MNLAATVQNTIRSILKLMYRIEIRGIENVPTEGPVVLCANHSGLIDGVLLLLASQRPQTVVAKHELFSSPAGFLFRAGDGIPIDWKSADREALHQSIEALRNGKALGIFPEGTRCRGQYDWVKDGVSYVLIKSVAAGAVPTILPVTILGTRPTGKSKSYFTKLGSSIHIEVGPPIGIASLQLESADATDRRSIDIVGERLRLQLLSEVRRVEEVTGLSMPEDDVSDYLERLV